MRTLIVDLSALRVETFATVAAGGPAEALAPTYPPYCNSYYTQCRCTPRADEP